MNYIECVGYAASVLVAIGYFMKDTTKLRVFGMIGAVVFVAYGLLIGSYPVAGLNLVIACTNAVYLTRGGAH